MEKYVSIIMPTYNRGTLIARSIQSVLAQTYPYFEFIIVDDASSDNTEQIVRTFKDERITYIKLESNGGPSVARNVGIKNAQYDYVAFEDSDDVWLPQKLEKQMALFSGEIGLVYCSYRYDNPDYFFRIPSENCSVEELSGDIFERLWRENTIGTPTMIVKKECLQTVGMFSESIRSLEDWELVLRIADRYKVAFLNEVMVLANYSKTGVNHHSIERIRSIVYIIEEFEYKKMEISHMLDYLFKDLILLPEKNDLDFWKQKIVPRYVATTSEFDLLFNIKRRNRILLEYNKILECMCDEKEFGQFLKKYVTKDDVVAVYGMGVVGRSLLKRLFYFGVNVECLIDKRRINIGDVETVKPDELCGKEIDKVFITVPDQYENIVKELKHFVRANYININEILE